MTEYVPEPDRDEDILPGKDNRDRDDEVGTGFVNDPDREDPDDDTRVGTV